MGEELNKIIVPGVRIIHRLASRRLPLKGSRSNSRELFRDGRLEKDRQDPMKYERGSKSRELFNELLQAICLLTRSKSETTFTMK